MTRFAYVHAGLRGGVLLCVHGRETAERMHVKTEKGVEQQQYKLNCNQASILVCMQGMMPAQKRENDIEQKY